MYNVLCHIPQPEDSTSWYRGVGVISHWRKLARNLQFIMTNKYNWSTVQSADLLFMQRPCTKEHVEIARMAIRARVPIWIDYDDLLLEVPTDNPTYFNYADEDTRKSILALLGVADLVTVTTGYLANYLSKYSKNIHIVPNALNERLFERVWQERQKVVVWRGSRTHQRDVMTVAQVLIETANNKRFADWVFCYLGDNLWFVTDHTPHQKTIVSKPLHVDEFNYELEKLRPTVIHVPLSDSPFNRSKSNIAWIEGTYAGAVTIAPDWEEWCQPGVLTYRTAEEYRLNLEAVMSGEVDVRAKNQESWNAIQRDFTLAKWNRRRTELVAEVMGTTPGVLFGQP